MKILPNNNTSFKAGLCTNYYNGKNGKKLPKYNYWPELIDQVRETSDFDEFEKLLFDVYKNTRNDVVLALEKSSNSEDYIFAAYKNEDEVFDDRLKKTLTTKYSINESGIYLKEIDQQNIEMKLATGAKSTFRNIIEAVRFILTNFKEKNSEVYKSLTSKKFLPAEQYLKQFAQKGIR